MTSRQMKRKPSPEEEELIRKREELAALEEELAQAQEVEDDSEAAPETEEPTKTTAILRDAYLDEGFAILEDNIRLQRHAKNSP